MRKVSLILASILTLFGALSASCGDNSNGNISQSGANAAFEGGDGSEDNPFVIGKDYQWSHINGHLSAHYILSADLFLDDVSLAPIGTETHPFEGTIDGMGHSLSSASIKGNGDVGLFGVCSGATIKNLRFIDSTINAGVKTGNCVGSFVSIAKKATLIENCHSKNISIKLIGDSYAKAYIGGFAGTIQSASSAIYCSSNVAITQTKFTFPRYGGFVGVFSGGQSGKIDACFCEGTYDAEGVYGNFNSMDPVETYIGGFVNEFSSGTISNCYTEVTFYYGKKIGLFTFKNMGDFNNILLFSEYKKTLKDAYGSNKLYYSAEVINNAISSSTIQSYTANTIDSSNNLLDYETEWKNNPVWKKGVIHPELVSYEEYLAAVAAESH